jgi:hypothetical protein
MHQVQQLVKGSMLEHHHRACGDANAEPVVPVVTNNKLKREVLELVGVLNLGNFKV